MLFKDQVKWSQTKLIYYCTFAVSVLQLGTVVFQRFIFYLQVTGEKLSQLYRSWVNLRQGNTYLHDQTDLHPMNILTVSHNT